MHGIGYIGGSIPRPLLVLITKIKVGKRARGLVNALKALNRPHSLHCCEIDIDLNPKCKRSGFMLEDKGYYDPPCTSVSAATPPTAATSASQPGRPRLTRPYFLCRYNRRTQRRRTGIAKIPSEGAPPPQTDRQDFAPSLHRVRVPICPPQYPERPRFARNVPVDGARGISPPEFRGGLSGRIDGFSL